MAVDDLFAAFATEFGIVSEENRFGSPSTGRVGVSDGAEGVQWSTLVNLREDAAYLVINLEGMKYDGWPIARFLEREFNHPRLFDIIPQLPAAEIVQLMVYRDAWQYSAHPPIEERHNWSEWANAFGCES